MRSVPRPQVRSDLAGGVLPVLRLLQSGGRSGDADPQREPDAAGAGPGFRATGAEGTVGGAASRAEATD